MSTPTAQELQTAQQLGQVQGQLNAITSLLNAHHEASNARMDDLRKSVETRFDSVDTRLAGLGNRLGKVEENERNTAIKAATAGAASGGLAFLVGEVIRAALRMKGG